MTYPTLATGDVARRLGVPAWTVRRLYERGLLPPAARFRTYRVFTEADVPKIEKAMRQAGYLPRPAAATD
jgi:DNA-binding transcriptional MerR regulator